MDLYLVITGDHLNWIDIVEKKSSEYYDVYIKEYKWPNFDWEEGVCHNGNSYVFDVDVFNFNIKYIIHNPF